MLAGGAQKTADLRFDLVAVFFDRFDGEHLSKLGLAAGIAHHGGSAPQYGDRAMPGVRQVGQRHERDQAAHMQAGGSGIEPAVVTDRALAQKRVQARFIAHLLNETALA